ncbi:MAG: thiamine monophosphate synthase [Betaproteobacteria bacterium]|nr:thiamine monophosphate synthase [Betaproteobacteria bacterium]
MPVTQVVAAVIYQPADHPLPFDPPWGDYLLAQRPQGKAYAGYWEFPGGKVEPGETHLEAIKREIREELDIEILDAVPWMVRRHVYEHASVELHFFRVTAWRGQPRGLENQRFVFQSPGQESVGPMLPANGPLLRGVALPTVYGITSAAGLGSAGMLARLEAALARGLRLVQVREPGMPREALRAFCVEVVARCHAHGAQVLVNGDAALADAVGADGVHLPSRDLMRLNRKPECALVGASIHNAEELAQAERLECDFAVLGAVLPTRTHPDAPPLGWEGYVRIAGAATLPVFALGGLTLADAGVARKHGAHGVAMLRGAWD